jgi:hypothetical protein
VCLQERKDATVAALQARVGSAIKGFAAEELLKNALTLGDLEGAKEGIWRRPHYAIRAIAISMHSEAAKLFETPGSRISLKVLMVIQSYYLVLVNV